MTDRDAKLTIRISEEERRMLQVIAEREGISSSDVLRLFIRRTYAERSKKKKARR